MTQVLLELCRLRGWAVVGMSIDYVKCFDLIPQAVVLALALELGMDPGTCCALGAMYKQPCRAFKIARAFSLWWQATNGILQGCPLSVILVNVLTTIWKWEVDSLHRQVCAQTAALPPTLDGEAADDLEPGIPMEGQRGDQGGDGSLQPVIGREVGKATQGALPRLQTPGPQRTRGLGASNGDVDAQLAEGRCHWDGDPPEQHRRGALFPLDPGARLVHADVLPRDPQPLLRRGDRFVDGGRA